jgi:hypothetical protein
VAGRDLEHLIAVVDAGLNRNAALRRTEGVHACNRVLQGRVRWHKYFIALRDKLL